MKNNKKDWLAGHCRKIGMLKTSLTAGPIPSIKKLDTIARKTGLIMRKSSRFSAHGFLLALSLSQHQAKPMSREAMHQRLNEAGKKSAMRNSATP